MAKITKTPPKTSSKTNGTVTEPVKAVQAKTEPVKTVTTAEPYKSVLAKAEPVKPITPRAEPAKPASPQPTISIELVKPGAKQVAIAGSFNDWKPERTPLVQIGNGRWVGDLAVKPGRHEYLFVVDGQWVPDPNAKENVQNPFGGKNSVLIVSA
jgi:hypothetical protein